VPKSEKHHKSKLKDEDVREIRKLLDLGVTQQRIANDYGVTIMAINCIKKGKTWKHVK